MWEVRGWAYVPAYNLRRTQLPLKDKCVSILHHLTNMLKSGGIKKIEDNTNKPQVRTNWKIKTGVNPHWDDTHRQANVDGCLE